MIRVLVLSPYPTLRTGLRAIVEGDEQMHVSAEGTRVDDLDEAMAWDVALVGVSDGGIPEHDSWQERGVVYLGVDPARARPEPRLAPRGYLSNDASPEEIIAAIRTVDAGLSVFDPVLAPSIFDERPVGYGEDTQVLTHRELEVLQLLATGLPNKTIAAQLGISEHTAKFHVSSVLSKLGASSRTEAVTLAVRRGLLLL